MFDCIVILPVWPASQSCRVNQTCAKTRKGEAQSKQSLSSTGEASPESRASGARGRLGRGRQGNQASQASEASALRYKFFYLWARRPQEWAVALPTRPLAARPPARPLQESRKTQEKRIKRHKQYNGLHKKYKTLPCLCLYTPGCLVFILQWSMTLLTKVDACLLSSRFQTKLIQDFKLK